jgi:hypothetical protein
MKFFITIILYPTECKFKANLKTSPGTGKKLETGEWSVKFVFNPCLDYELSRDNWPGK